MQRVWSMYLDSQQRARTPTAQDSQQPADRISMAGSAYSASGSTRHILGGHKNGSSNDHQGNYAAMHSAPASASGVSLMVNYLPSKFGATYGSRRGSSSELRGPQKQGGGLAAFKVGEQRMGGKLRWTRFKWILFLTNVLCFLYSLGGLVLVLLTWFNVFEKSEIIRLGNKTELIVATIAAALGFFTAVLGFAGILLNNRAFLSWYAFLLWIVFAFLVTPGYITFRKRQYNLEGKVNAQWSRALDPYARMRIQSQLQCCGYYSPFVEATVSQTCYARSILPGCKLPYLDYQREILRVMYTIIFAIVPAQLFTMVIALMCSNHVTYRFGKGMMPAAYRLDMNSMAVIMDQHAAQLAEQYGDEVANRVMERSRSDLQLRSERNR